MLVQHIKYFFIVLHYLDLEATLKCVASIQEKVSEGNYSIIIVDNGSYNKTGVSLKNIYNKNNMVKVIINSTNIGFAKGLNLGIEYVNKLHDFDYIILLNNDTEIISNNWLSIIESKYKQHNYDVLGPDIISLDGKIHSNPVLRQVDSINKLRRIIHYRKISYLLYLIYFAVIYRKFKDIIKKFLRFQSKIPDFIKEDKVDVQLQGSCFILSKKFFIKHDKLFDETFLYFEEAILRYIADRDNLKMVYTPDLQLLHKENSSTNIHIRTFRRKNVFFLKHSIRSCKIMLRMMKVDQKRRRAQ